MAGEFKDVCWATITLADFLMISRSRETFLIVALFIFIPNWGNRDLPKGVNPESQKPPEKSYLTQQCKFRRNN